MTKPPILMENFKFQIWPGPQLSLNIFKLQIWPGHEDDWPPILTENFKILDSAWTWKDDQPSNHKF